MKRSYLNLCVDVLAFAAFLFLATTGVLLRYQLPPGSGERFGRGAGFGAAHREVATLWGWTRHEWGDVHFWIACVLLAILTLHIVLHWKWIVCVVRGRQSNYSGLRLAIGACAAIALVLVSLAPVLSPVERQTRAELERAATQSQLDATQRAAPQPVR